jgi:maleate isomerase
VNAPRRVRLGMITPSSNTALEPATAALAARMPGISVHFARFRVTQIALGEESNAQFDMAPMLAAADLLGDARCDAICWNGTSGSWLGLDRDRALCAAIRSRTGIPATTASLALLQEFAARGVRRFGLVTPYTGDVQSRIAALYAEAGYECVAERHSDLRENFSFAEVPAPEVERMVREVAAARPDAIVVLCTNMDASGDAPRLSRDFGVPVLDSIAVALEGAVRTARGP